MQDTTYSVSLSVNSTGLEDLKIGPSFDKAGMLLNVFEYRDAASMRFSAASLMSLPGLPFEAGTGDTLTISSAAIVLAPINQPC